MNSTVGEGMVAMALAAAFVGYQYLKHQHLRKRMEIIHQERLVAMEKGIPLPELPLEPGPDPRGSDPDYVIPILGMVLLSLSLGTMIVLYLNSDSGNSFWVAPLPFAFLGVGFLAVHFLKPDERA
jgi:hypothetical protein